MIMKFMIRGFIILLFYFATSMMEYNSVLAKENIESSSCSIANFEILEDQAGIYSFEEISSSDYASQYRNYPGEVISLGITRSVYWVRFKQRGETVPNPFLQLNNANIDKIDVYIPTLNKNSIENHYMVKKVGVGRPNSSRDIMDNSWVFQLPREYNDQNFIYLRLESSSALRLPVLFWSSDSFIAASFLKNMGFGAFYGILLVMLSFNLFIYLVLRDKAYLFYALYMSFMFLYQFQVHGHLKMLVDIPYGIYNAIFWLWLAAAFISSTYFTRQFLQVKTAVPQLDKVLTGIIMISILQGILGIFGYNFWANQIAHGLGILGPVFIIILGIIRFRQGFRPARYYIIAWGVLSIGIVVWTLSAYLSGIFSSVNYLLIATASESVLLSFALADRMKTLRWEREALSKRVQWYRDLSLTDAMTGLYNKRYFDKKMSEETTLALECGKPMSLLVIDIDNFKLYNDTYGHWEGDQVIVRLGEILLKWIENGQWAFRYGGEEFVLLLSNTRCNDANCIAENLRKTFMTEHFAPGTESSVTVTISIGLTELCHEDNHESLFQRADEALYRAKKNGRNQTVAI